ncbi:MAG: hypothetical protein GX230_11145 [Lentisphaerae bacterium]|jgi:hypothetical protein|nr:hypothetical protein [Lentisphaerota bacterium]
MNVFILNTGRCGSTTFIKASSHITNFSSGHETLAGTLGEGRLAYADNHIEADNRLSWFLGRLDNAYGDNAFYVHLSRNRQAVAKSYGQRIEGGIIRAYRRGMLMRLPQRYPPEIIAGDYCDTVTANIELFLKDKTRKMAMQLENIEQQFPIFWQAIGAEGDLQAAMAEWQVTHNATTTTLTPKALFKKIKRGLVR